MAVDLNSFICNIILREKHISFCESFASPRFSFAGLWVHFCAAETRATCANGNRVSDLGKVML